MNVFVTKIKIFVLEWTQRRKLDSEIINIWGTLSYKNLIY